LAKAQNFISENYFDTAPYVWICMGQSAEIFPLNFCPFSSKGSWLQG